MNRLNFHLDRPQNQTSGAWINTHSSSTLRARLSSLGPSTAPDHAAASSSSDSPSVPHLQLQDIYEHFYECFSAAGKGKQVSLQTPGHNSGASKKEDGLAQLKDSFARAALELHSSVVDQLCQANAEIACKISDFSEESSAVSSKMESLYSNLEYPLNATLCSSDNFPISNIANHLSGLLQRLKAAEGELSLLRDEWNANLQKEQGIRSEVSGLESHISGPELMELLHETQAFKEEAERIAADKIQEIEDVEKNYKILVQAETVTIMKSFLSD